MKNLVIPKLTWGRITETSMKSYQVNLALPGEGWQRLHQVLQGNGWWGIVKYMCGEETELLAAWPAEIQRLCCGSGRKVGDLVMGKYSVQRGLV